MKLKIFIIFLIFSFFIEESYPQIRLRPPKIKDRSEQIDTSSQVIDFQVDTSDVEDKAKLINAIASKDIPEEQKELIKELPIPDSIVIPSLDFSNQPIQDVLRLLSAPYNINISVAPSLKAKITLRLTDIKLKDVILFIIKENGYDFKIINDIIKVFKPELKPPEPEKPKPRKQIFEVTEGKLTVDVKDAELDSIIRWIAGKTDMNIVPEKGMKASITAFLKDMPLEKGLYVLFETNGLQMVTKDKVTYLMPIEGWVEGEEKKDARVKHFLSVKNGRVTFNLTNASISSIIKEISKQANLDIYMYGSIEGSVTAKITHTLINDVFEFILRNTNHTYWISRGIYFFGSKSIYEKKVYDLVEINYLQADQVLSLLPESIRSKASFKIVKEYNAILIETSTTDIIEATKDFIKLLDKPVAQILIEAWVVEVELDKMRKIDLELFARKGGSGGGDRSYFPQISGDISKKSLLRFIENFIKVGKNFKALIPDDFAGHLELLETEGITNLISKPQIATLNGHSATITFGTTQYYLLEKEVIATSQNQIYPIKDQRYEKISIDMTLTVKPWVSGNKEVTMEISPNFDVPGTSPAPNIPPPVNRRSLKSTVRVKDGEMIILGGLISELEKTEFKKLPFLGNIPILKWFFSSSTRKKTKTQLMIYLIPHVYYGSEKAIDPESIRKDSLKPPKFVSDKKADDRESRKARRKERREDRRKRREARRQKREKEK